MTTTETLIDRYYDWNLGWKLSISDDGFRAIWKVECQHNENGDPELIAEGQFCWRGCWDCPVLFGEWGELEGYELMALAVLYQQVIDPECRAIVCALCPNAVLDDDRGAMKNPIVVQP